MDGRDILNEILCTNDGRHGERVTEVKLVYVRKMKTPRNKCRLKLIYSYIYIYKKHGGDEYRYIMLYCCTHSEVEMDGIPPPEVVFVNKRWIFMRRNTADVCGVAAAAPLPFRIGPTEKKV